MKQRVTALCIVAVAAMMTMTGCFKAVKIGEEGKITGKTEFNAGDNVAEIWESDALPELNEKAVSLNTFLSEANGDLKSLVDKYGKYSMGTSGEINYVVKGTGTIEEVNRQSKSGYMIIKLDDYTGDEVMKLQIGSVFKGSSVRDSLDFIKFGDYTNQQEWAAVSQSINELIDSTVIKDADVESLQGKKISFVGAFTANDDKELVITPVAIEVQ